MATCRENQGDFNILLKQFAGWFLLILVGCLCVLVIGRLRARTPGNIGSSSQDFDSSPQADPAFQRLAWAGDLTPVVGDWNGDGRDEIGVYQAYGENGRFLVDSNGNGSPDPADRSTAYGPSGVTPIVGDWNGDGRHQIGVYRAYGDNGKFILDYDDNGAWAEGDRVYAYGLASDTPIVGDWNGDGRDEVGNFRAAGDLGEFILDSNGNGVWDPTDRAFSYGLASDTPIVGDWNGDGRDEVGLLRAAGDLGEFILDSNGNGAWDPTDRTYAYGLASDTPIVGDWNGDGRDQVGNFRVAGNLGHFILDSNDTGGWEPSDTVHVCRLEGNTTTVSK